MTIQLLYNQQIDNDETTEFKFNLSNIKTLGDSDATIASKIKRILQEATKYNWICRKTPKSNKYYYEYYCEQSTIHQRNYRKHEDSTKHHNKPMQNFFKCLDHVKIQIDIFKDNALFIHYHKIIHPEPYKNV
ncbi:hypothetical protein F8M41_011215 [Gigaspora margarita]|uniref:Uncharacterized protein n=1 Tax=Gigaspora margarita TaxID=4874 RepID=A0A8H4B3Y3_GIGMA|nr:hypothetical protein F8M41_011215 [Gigaspora margarita]